MKKVVSILISVSLILMSVPVFAMSGAGTESNPYLISSASDIARIHDDLGGYYKLTADIDMQGIDFTPIGNEDEGAFTGTIDGDGYTISNLNLNLPENKYVGFVGYLEGMVKNLNLDSVDAYGCRYVGGIAGYAEIDSGIYNCIVNGNICGEGKVLDLNIGGIAGYSNTEIKKCINNADVSSAFSKSRVGGICGYNAGTITECINAGPLTSSLVGGITGYNIGTIIDCNNTSIITALGFSNLISTYVSYSGGITGYNAKAINNCNNTGKVSATDNSFYPFSGGIAGGNSGQISLCSNNGIISSEGYIGGIVGENLGKIINCYNSGSVSARKNQTKSYYAGGISGVNRNRTSIISACINTGHVSCSYYTDSAYSSSQFYSYSGGIVGTLDRGTINNCSNHGYVSSFSRNNAFGGGIAGYVSNEGIINNCYNTGSILASGTYSYSRGISGNQNGNMTNCYSMSEICKTSYPLFFYAFNDPSSFNGFDFDETWFIDHQIGSGVPQLRNMPRHIELNECVELFEVGDSDRLYAYIDDNSESVTWSCDDASIATVSSNGTVTAKAIGSCTVTATNSEGMKANCLIYVYGRANSMQLSNDEVTINENVTYSLSPIEYPNTANENVVWYTENESIATVDQSGVVTAKAKGTTTVYAVTAQSNIRANCTIHVSAPITSISLSTTDKTLKLGDSDVITATILPSDYEGGITWDSSDDDVVSVNQSGKITANKIGTAYITATASSGVSAKCTVTVTQPATGIKLNKSAITTYVGSVYQLSATVLPFDTTDTITWSSNSTSYATVSSTGLVTGQRAGTATITARTSSGLTATCYVTVKAAKVEPTSLSLGDTYIILAPDDAKALTATILPTNTTETQLTWTSSDESVAIVNQSGVVTAVSNGFATVKATSSNGLTAECVVKVVSAIGTSVILSNTKASPGGTAQVKASIVRNPGISGYKFTVDYDDTILTPVSVEVNPEFGGTLTSNLNDNDRTELIVFWYSGSDVDINGDLFIVNFKVNEVAEYGDSSDITLSYGARDIGNASGGKLALYIQNGTVSVEEPLPGDIYEDNEINAFDLNLLSRYITRLDTLTERQIVAADVNNDNEVDIKDVVTVAQYLVNWTGVELMSFRGMRGIMGVNVGTTSVNESLEAEIPVYVTNNSGIAGFRYVIKHSEELEILSITPTKDVIKDKFQTNLGQQGDNDLIVSWYDTDNMTENGELFKIKVRLTNPDADISQISIKPADNNMCNENKQDVIAEYENGYVMSSNYMIANQTITDTKFNCELYFDNTFEEQTAKAILAFYDEQHKIVQFKLKDITVKPGKVDLNFDIKNKPYSTYKLMLWEGMHSMRPLVSVR